MTLSPLHWGLWDWCCVSAAMAVALGFGLLVLSLPIFKRFVRVRNAIEHLGEPWPFERWVLHDANEFLKSARGKAKGW